ncbi:decarboxylating 6-phosphogluconate dehydrogenase [Candidatus Dependentiae bacterium]|nr:decarboxylating 6-phosphogluconate dehydrogenase [Candidatus Dependentiae bacterium]
MKVGLIGLGRMGIAIAERLLGAKIHVVGFDENADAVKEFEKMGGQGVRTAAEVGNHTQIFWLMVPAGDAVDEVIDEIYPNLRSKAIVIDGGNSKFTDSIKRAEKLNFQGVRYLDCGTSGGLHGKENGFSLMIGGDAQAYKEIEPVFKAIAAPKGYGLVGPSGAGHYVKMVHNGIEYALLQAYAEGLHLLHANSHYKELDLAQITDIWNHGSIIRSWILDLAHRILERDQDFAKISGKIFESGTGKWTVEEAHRHHVPVKLIEDALKIRADSRETDGDYATKLVALLRHEFGGHKLG